MNITEFLAVANAIVPDRTAITFEGLRISFSELEHRVTRLANALRKLGIGAGNRVAIMDTNNSATVEAYLASAKLDAVFVPLNYRSKATELSSILRICDPTVLLVGARYRSLVQMAIGNRSGPKHLIIIGETSRDGWVSYEQMINSCEDSEELYPSGDRKDTTLLLFTAGTTGTPKAVMLSHDSFCSSILSTVDPPDPSTEERTLISVPLYHVAGIHSALAAIYGGRTLVIMRQFEPDEWMSLVQTERIHRVTLVPTMLKQILDHPKFCEYDLSTLGIITYGASPMPLELIKRAISSFPKAGFINAFGQTETASTITMLSPDDHILTGSSEERSEKLRRLTSVGKPVEDVELAIVDEYGSKVPAGRVGEVVVRGERIMNGYWKESNSTKITIRNNWLYTGDLGYQDDDGYLYISGRSRDFIKRGGEMISPGEVEDVLRTHPLIEEAAIIGVSDTQWGERIRAVIVLRQGESITESEIIRYCHERLASFKKPESIVFAQELPYNHMGKILKRVLRKRYSDPIN